VLIERAEGYVEDQRAHRARWGLCWRSAGTGSRLMNSAGLCAALSCRPWWQRRWGSGTAH